MERAVKSLIFCDAQNWSMCTYIDLDKSTDKSRENRERERDREIDKLLDADEYVAVHPIFNVTPRCLCFCVVSYILSQRDPDSVTASYLN